MPRFYFIVDNGYSRKKVWRSVAYADRDKAEIVAKALVANYFNLHSLLGGHHWYRIRTSTKARRYLDEIQSIVIESRCESDQKKITGAFEAMSTIRFKWPETI